MPVEGVDVLVTNKAVDGKTLAELAQMPAARGVFLRKITRGATATDIPILPNTKVQRGDLLTIVGRTQDTNAAIKLLGVADRATDVTDMAFVGACDHDRRAVRLAGPQRRRRAADAVHGRRRADRGNRRRLAAVRSSVLRAHPDADRSGS